MRVIPRVHQPRIGKAPRDITFDDFPLSLQQRRNLLGHETRRVTFNDSTGKHWKLLQQRYPSGMLILNE